MKRSLQWSSEFTAKSSIEKKMKVTVEFDGTVFTGILTNK